MKLGAGGNTLPTLQAWTSRKFVFDEDEFDLFCLLHCKDWVFGYRIFDYASYEETEENGKIYIRAEGQSRRDRPIPWMQVA
jgi:hypothetical protein